MVQDIEEFGPELQARSFCQLEVLEQRQIPAIESRACDLRRLVAPQDSCWRGLVDTASGCSRSAKIARLRERRCIQHGRIAVRVDMDRGSRIVARQHKGIA